MVAPTFASQDGWCLHLIDMNVKRGEKAAKFIGPSTRFHNGDMMEIIFGPKGISTFWLVRAREVGCYGGHGEAGYW